MSSPARTHLGQWTDFPPLPPWIVALFSPRLAGSYPTLPPPHSLPSATALYSNPHHQETTIILYPPTIHQFCPTPSITNFVPLVLPMSSHPFAFSIVLFTPKTIPRSDLYQRRLPLPLRFQLLPPPEPPKKVHLQTIPNFHQNHQATNQDPTTYPDSRGKTQAKFQPTNHLYHHCPRCSSFLSS